MPAKHRGFEHVLFGRVQNNYQLDKCRKIEEKSQKQLLDFHNRINKLERQNMPSRLKNEHEKVNSYFEDNICRRSVRKP